MAMAKVKLQDHHYDLIAYVVGKWFAMQPKPKRKKPAERRSARARGKGRA